MIDLFEENMSLTEYLLNYELFWGMGLAGVLSLFWVQHRRCMEKKSENIASSLPDEAR